MANTYMQLYEVPLRHLLPSTTWLHAMNMQYFTRFGLQSALIQVAGSQEELSRFQMFIRELWVLREHSIFPKKYSKLVAEELDSWGIEYERTKNPFAFEIITEIDERKLSRFLHAVREVTKKPKRKKREPGQKRSSKVSKIPDDISSLLE
jgi:hypothetical protein